MPVPMQALATRLRTRLIPALLTALGVSFIAAGQLSYTSSANAVDQSAESDETIVTETASPSHLITFPPVSIVPSPSASPSGASPSPSPTPSNRVATRVVIPALHIDLPVVNPPGGSGAYPLCDVAMYVKE